MLLCDAPNFLEVTLHHVAIVRLCANLVDPERIELSLTRCKRVVLPLNDEPTIKIVKHLILVNRPEPMKKLWSGVGKSNPFLCLGKAGHNQYTNPAKPLVVRVRFELTIILLCKRSGFDHSHHRTKFTTKN